jgi:hypothetical protein
MVEADSSSAIVGVGEKEPTRATGAESRIDNTAWRELTASFVGELVQPGEPTYDEQRRVWNGSINRRPALIARCRGAADVATALRCARRTGLPVAVRSGGHSFPGVSVCDNGIVVDLGLMKRIELDPAARTATVDAGVLLGELDAATQAHGLAVPAGIVTHTGVAGLTLGGGIGWIMRKHGLSIDQLLSVNVVTAEGTLLRASEDENADLFWGIRGGGGNFGVVTQFRFKLNSLGPIVLAGPILWRMDDAPEVLRFYRDWISDVPDELMTIVVLRKAPALDFVPTELHGEPVISIVCCYAGAVEEGNEVLRPMQAFGSPVLDLCFPKPFLEHQAMFDPSFPHHRWYYNRACDVAELTDEVIDITVEHSLRIRSPLTTYPIWQLGGAVARVPRDETAYDTRNAGHAFNITASTETEDGFDEEREWVRNLWSALEPFHTSVYVNFLGQDEEQRVGQAYGPGKYERLKALKRKYDPENLLCLNQNIPPD